FSGTILPEVLFYYRRRADSMSRSMLDEQAYRRPLETLIAKHRDAYRDHLVDVLVAKEAEALHLVGETHRVERGRLVDLEPALRRAREEALAAETKAARVRQIRAREEEQERLAWKVGELEHEVAALRASWSWRITAPLRRVYGFLIGERR